ncbi:RHS repeat-associated core domain-containing protein [bacterium]|nr:RHS repeat-associated core domain-containing protein [bacterium]
MMNRPDWHGLFLQDIDLIDDDQDRLLTYDDATFTYTDNGELLTKTENGQTTSYTYDELGNLINVTLPDSTLIEYIIDATNRRIGKKVNSTLTRKFLYDSQIHPIAELDASDTIVSLFGPGYMIKNGVTYRLITDHLGSIRMVVNKDTGAIVQQMDYDEFGNVITDTNPGFQPFGFAGGLYDADTGLVRFGYRDYDSMVGRWIIRDIILFTSSERNLYVYVEDDPINWIDNNGLSKSKVIEKAGYIFIKVPGDTMHGGPHWHVFKRKGMKLLARVSLTGKILTGSCPTTALKLLKAAGGITSILSILLLDPPNAEALTRSDWAIEQYSKGELSETDLIDILTQTGEIDSDE